MSIKVYLSPSNQNRNTYAAGKTNEMEQCNRIAVAAETALKRCGFAAKRAPKGQSMAVSINESNAWGANLHVSIHTNAGGGKGPEVFVHSTADANMKIARPVFKELVAVSYSKVSRHLGTYPYGGTLGELQNTNAIAVYCECEFHDNANIAKWIIDNVTAIGEAICKGICTGYGVKYVTPSSDSSSGAADKQMYYVRKNWGDKKSQIGAFEILKNAKNMADKNKGYYVFDKTGKKVYTPVTSNSTKNTVTVKGKTTYIRLSGHCKAKGLKAVTVGTKLTWISDDGWGWSMVQYGKIKGWIQNSRLSGKNGLSTWRIATCNGTNVQARADATTASKAICSIGKGKTFTITCIVPSEDPKYPGTWIMTGGIIKGKDVYVYNDKSYISIGGERK